MHQLVIQPYTDGPHPTGYDEVVQSWKATWQQHYSSRGNLEFAAPINLKRTSNRSALPQKLQQLERIRNPDVYFTTSQGIELGGIEITDHSPDGSNIEKRYPYLWASRRMGVNAFAVSRFLKQRPGGQINRLPFRHAQRNIEFLKEWQPSSNDAVGQLCQFLPLLEMHLEDIQLVPAEIRTHLPSWTTLGQFYAHLTAFSCCGSDAAQAASVWLSSFKQQLENLSTACMAQATRETEASTLLKLPDRWIQVYNTRPDSGHWERGEGQFDSIDGRLMFTLDEISLLPAEKRPARFEFWLPQLASNHAWIAEQRLRGYGSKRLRNIMVELSGLCHTRFADDLTEEDWNLLSANRGLLLERLDWQPGIYQVKELLSGHAIPRVAEAGLTYVAASVRSEILNHITDETLHFSSHRAYIPDWQSDLEALLKKLPDNAVVLVPRIPGRLLSEITKNLPIKVISAEACTKIQLLTLRQIHRNIGAGRD